MALPRYAAYCACGASLTLREPKAVLADYLLALFWRDHQGVGHGATPAAGARRARGTG